jgi:hypothetical protein
MILKIFAVTFALFALRRVIVRYRRGGTLTLEFLLWLAIWSGIGAVVFIPSRTDALARFIGVSSGFNALTFITVTGLLFAVFRLIYRVQTLQRDMTQMVRAMALKNAEQPASDKGAAELP